MRHETRLYMSMLYLAEPIWTVRLGCGEGGGCQQRGTLYNIKMKQSQTQYRAHLLYGFDPFIMLFVDGRFFFLFAFIEDEFRDDLRSAVELPQQLRTPPAVCLFFFSGAPEQMDKRPPISRCGYKKIATTNVGVENSFSSLRDLFNGGFLFVVSGLTKIRSYLSAFVYEITTKIYLTVLKCFLNPFLVIFGI